MDARLRTRCLSCGPVESAPQSRRKSDSGMRESLPITGITGSLALSSAAAMVRIRGRQRPLLGV